MKTGHQIAIVLGIAVLGVGLYLGLPGNQPGQSQANGGPGGFRADMATQVVAEPVIIAPQRYRVEAVGTAEAIRSASLYPAVSGEVMAVSLVPNGRVVKGDVLLELDQRAEKLAVELARVKVKDSQQLLARYERTAGSGAVPASTIDEARNNLESARIELQQAEVALDDRTVRAPFDGYTGLTDVEVGDRIDPSTMIASIDERDRLLIRFSLPELSLGRIALGQPVNVAMWDDRSNPIAGTIVDLDSRLDPETRSIVARAQIQNPDDRLRPGMSFAVTVDVEGHTYPLVPEIAVQWGAEGAYVWTVEDGKAERAQVHIVQRQQGTALVDADLSADDRVITEGIQRLRPGMKVAETDPQLASSPR
jgi:membrane fusion protein, multidrug efflux system